MTERLYFAYGSNINLNQMAVRCPAAQVVGPAVLDGYELLFRGNRRGTGVATIEPLHGSQVHGLLWNLTPACEQSLDIYEGYPRLYEKGDIIVRTMDGKEVTVMEIFRRGRPHRHKLLLQVVLHSVQILAAGGFCLLNQRPEGILAHPIVRFLFYRSAPSFRFSFCLPIRRSCSWGRRP